MFLRFKVFRLVGDFPVILNAPAVDSLTRVKLYRHFIFFWICLTWQSKYIISTIKSNLWLWQDFKRLTLLGFHLCICNLKILHVFSTYHRLARRKLTTTFCIKKQSEINFIIPSVLIGVKRFKYHASIVELAYYKRHHFLTTLK